MNYVQPEVFNQICTNCVMDTTDPSITFDKKGVCDHCHNYYRNILPNWHPDEEGRKTLDRLVDRIKKDGVQKEHDCIIGISGGIDSSYLTYLAKEELRLRPLLFHVDTGWNSQLAVNNIEKLIDYLGLDLYTEVINWEEMRDLQLAFFKAQVPHLDTPQDHAIFAGIYNFAAKHRIKYILTGANYSTECVHNPLEWHYHAGDLVHLKDIHKKFGQRPLATFPLADILTYRIRYRLMRGVKVVRPLNYVPFVKSDAGQLLTQRFEWQQYSQKHYESRFTKFYEGYWLPNKFGIDKRKVQFSSLILTGQLSRQDAIEQLSEPAYDERTISEDFEYVAAKLDISPSALHELMNGPNKSFQDYKTRMWLFTIGTKLLTFMGLERRAIR